MMSNFFRYHVFINLQILFIITVLTSYYSHVHFVSAQVSNTAAYLKGVIDSLPYQDQSQLDATAAAFGLDAGTITPGQFSAPTMNATTGSSWQVSDEWPLKPVVTASDPTITSGPARYVSGSPYWSLQGVECAKVVPSQCGNGPTIIDQAQFLMRYELTKLTAMMAGEPTLCDQIKYALTNPPLDAYLTPTQLAGIPFMSCGLSDACMADGNCCPWIKAMIAGYASTVGTGTKETQAPLWELVVNCREELATIAPLIQKFGFLDKDLSKPGFPVLKSSAFYPAFNGIAGYSLFDQKSPISALSGNLAKYWLTCSPMPSYACPFHMNFSIEAPYPNYSFDVGEHLGADYYYQSYPHVFWQINRCQDLSTMENVGFFNKDYNHPKYQAMFPNVANWTFTGRNQPGFTHPDCSDSLVTVTRDGKTYYQMIYRPRLSATDGEGSTTLGSNTGNIYGKHELFVAVTGGYITGSQNAFTTLKSARAVESALQIVNHVNQTAFPNLKDFFFGMVFAEDTQSTRAVASKSVFETAKRFPSGTLAIVGESHEDSAQGIAAAANTLGGLGLIWLVFFISLCMMTISLLQCYDHPVSYNGNGKSSMRSFPEVLCGEGGDHIPMILFGLLGLFVYILGPLAYIYKLCNYIQEDPEHRLNTVKYYFLIARYGVYNMHWTYIVLCRNLFLAFIPIVFAAKASFQLLVFSLFASSFACLISFKKPWLSPALNVLDTIILLSVGLMSAWGFAFVYEQEEDADDVALSATVSLCVVLFVTIFIMLSMVLSGEFLGLRSPILIKYGLQMAHGTTGAQLARNNSLAVGLGQLNSNSNTDRDDYKLKQRSSLAIEKFGLKSDPNQNTKVSENENIEDGDYNSKTDALSSPDSHSTVNKMDELAIIESRVYEDDPGSGNEEDKAKVLTSIMASKTLKEGTENIDI